MARVVVVVVVVVVAAGAGVVVVVALAVAGLNGSMPYGSMKWYASFLDA